MTSLNTLTLAFIGVTFLTVCNSQRENIFKIPKRGQKAITAVTEKPLMEKRHITILYEALCPDSERFMTQIGPVFDDLKDYVQLEFVPFGLTKLFCKSIINGKCEHPVFTCKHGPAGCRANRQHDCALQYAASQEQQLSFIKCTMGAHKASVDKCLYLLGYNLYNIDTCMTFEEGTELQLRSYNKTVNFKPKKLPVILFDGQHSEEQQLAAIKDFRVFICSLLSNKYNVFNQSNAPTICRSDDIFPKIFFPKIVN